MPKTIGVYGTLKKGHYNYERFNMDEEAKPVGTTEITGAMDLFAASYPRLYPEGTYPEVETVHTLELYEIPEKMFNQMDSMERGAGYQAHEIPVRIEGFEGVVTVWLMNPLYEIDMECYIKGFN